MEQLIVGDIVHVKSGSPKMTIIEMITDNTAKVLYFPYGSNLHMIAEIPVIALEKKR